MACVIMFVGAGYQMEIYLNMRYLMVLVPINPLVYLVNPYFTWQKKWLFFFQCVHGIPLKNLDEFLVGHVSKDAVVEMLSQGYRVDSQVPAAADELLWKNDPTVLNCGKGK